jgi:hypothetical protein
MEIHALAIARNLSSYIVRIRYQTEEPQMKIAAKPLAVDIGQNLLGVGKTPASAGADLNGFSAASDFTADAVASSSNIPAVSSTAETNTIGVSRLAAVLDPRALNDALTRSIGSSADQATKVATNAATGSAPATHGGGSGSKNSFDDQIEQEEWQTIQSIYAQIKPDDPCDGPV